MEKTPSHPCPLFKHNKQFKWRCDRVSGSEICRSGIIDFNSLGLEGWRC